MVRVVDVTTEPCRLSGYPRVQVLNRRHHREAVAIRHGALGPKEPRKVSRVTLSGKRGRARFGLSFTDHPGPARSSDCHEFRLIRVRLPGQRTFHTVATDTPAEVCGPLLVSPIGAAGKR